MKIGLFTRLSMALKSVTHPEELLRVFGGGTRSTSGSVVNEKTALSISAVYSCIHVISETLGMLPFFVYKKVGKGKEEATKHPVWRVLMEKPNAWQTPMEFIEMVTAHACFRGNGYAFINWIVDPISRSNIPMELIPIHPDRVRMVIEQGYDIYYYIYPDSCLLNPKQDPIARVPREDMLHLRGLSLNSFQGLSVLQYHKETLGFGLTLQEHGSAMFANGARIAGVLEHPGTLGKGVPEKIREQWHDTFGGTANSGKTAVLEEGMKFKEVMMTAEDAQFLESRKYNRSEIASIFRVPPHKIGDLEKATFSNIEQQSIEFISDCILPWARRWELAVTRDLIDAKGTYFAQFDFDTLLRGDLASRYKAWATGRQWGWLSSNDIRAKENMNPIENGDTYLEPINMKPAGTLLDDPVSDPAVDPTQADQAP